MTTMGQRIKKVRLALNMSQEEFGKIFDSGKAYISLLENNKSKLSLESLVKLLVNYNVDINYILAEKGQPFIAPQFEQVRSDIALEVRQILREEGLIK